MVARSSTASRARPDRSRRNQWRVGRASRCSRPPAEAAAEDSWRAAPVARRRVPVRARTDGLRAAHPRGRRARGSDRRPPGSARGGQRPSRTSTGARGGARGAARWPTGRTWRCSTRSPTASTGSTRATRHFVNPAAARPTGHTAEQTLGRRAHDLVHHRARTGRPTRARAARAPVGSAAWCAPWMTRSRARRDSFPVEYTTTPIREGDTARARSCLPRHSERRRIESELSASTPRSRQARRDRRTGLGNPLRLEEDLAIDDARRVRDGPPIAVCSRVRRDARTGRARTSTSCRSRPAAATSSIRRSGRASR